MSIRIVQFLAVLLIAFVLVPAGAHLASLTNKIDMSQDQYLIAQKVYGGWALSGFFLVAAMAAAFALAVFSRSQTTAFALATMSFILLFVTLVTFFLWIFPANQATHDWTIAPGNWRMLRTRWEYTHAANAILTLAAFIAALLAALTWSQPGR